MRNTLNRIYSSLCKRAVAVGKLYGNTYQFILRMYAHLLLGFRHDFIVRKEVSQAIKEGILAVSYEHENKDDETVTLEYNREPSFEDALLSWGAECVRKNKGMEEIHKGFDVGWVNKSMHNAMKGQLAEDAWGLYILGEVIKEEKPKKEETKKEETDKEETNKEGGLNAYAFFKSIVFTGLEVPEVLKYYKVMATRGQPYTKDDIVQNAFLHRDNGILFINIDQNAGADLLCWLKKCSFDYNEKDLPENFSKLPEWILCTLQSKNKDTYGILAQAMETVFLHNQYKKKAKGNSKRRKNIKNFIKNYDDFWEIGIPALNKNGNSSAVQQVPCTNKFNDAQVQNFDTHVHHDFDCPFSDKILISGECDKPTVQKGVR